MKNIAFTAILGALAAQASGVENRPNIVVILVDDMGYSDIGCFGSEIRTPNIDRLAREGMSMTQFYNTGRSCPSRAALLTGMYHHKAGMGAMIRPVGDIPAYQGYLNANCMTIAEALGANGYATYMSGKWHLGDKPGQWPADRGFQNSYVFLGGACNYYHPNKPGSKSSNMARNHDYISVPGEGFYMTDVLSDEAAKFIGENPRDKPFFLYLAYTAPHWPLQAPAENIARYKGVYDRGWDWMRRQRYERMVKSGIVGKNEKLSPRNEEVPSWEGLGDADKARWARLMELYAGVIDRMDHGVGVVIDALQKSGQLDNTVVMFLSDNGGCREETKDFADQKDYPGVWGSGESFQCYELWANLSNTPFRYFKRWMHEGGISTPLIVRYPKMVKKGSKNNVPAHLIDIMPTCLALSSTSYPAEKNLKPLDGISLTPLLGGSDSPLHDALLFEHLGFRALRAGDWKIVSSFPDNKWQLYNMALDRSELNDLSDQMPEKVEELASLYRSKAAESEVTDWREVMQRNRQMSETKTKTKK
ncbi:arylsulfatase [Bacteroidia bacterium]|nr:arylsulfatase [Bacteroidia bacterium]